MPIRISFVVLNEIKQYLDPHDVKAKKVVIAEFTSKQIPHFPLQSRVVANMMLSSCIFSTRNVSREQWYRRW